MNPCPICKSYKINYAFKNNNNQRYLRCNECDVIFTDMSGTDEKVTGSFTKNDKAFKNLEELIDYLSKVRKGKKIEITEYFDSKDNDLLNENINYILSKKSILILLNRYCFENVEIKEEPKSLALITATKKQESSLKITFIVPAYNEEKTIEKIINSLTNIDLDRLDREIIVVESKSTDGTRVILERIKNNTAIKIIYQDMPLGKGNAVREGLMHASGDFISIQDADDEYDIQDYLNLIPPLIYNGETFVLGSRHSGAWWKMRKFTNQPIRAFILNLGQVFFTKLINVVTNQKMTDPFTMYKLFRRDAIGKINLESNRFDFDWELVIKLIQNGNKPLEIPVNYKSRSFEEGKKVNMIRDPLTWVIALVKYGILKK